MNHSRCCLCVVLIASPAFGSSTGFREYLAHPHETSFALPQLHGSIPSHIPSFTNEGAIRFWEQHPHSNVLRNASFEVQLCEAVTARRNLDTQRFDHYHPILGHLLRDPQYLQYALHLYRSNPSRFVHYHHHLIAVIRGCALMMQNEPSESIPNPGTITENPPPEGIAHGPTAAVPAPPSILLLTLGVVCSALVVGFAHGAQRELALPTISL